MTKQWQKITKKLTKNDKNDKQWQTNDKKRQKDKKKKKTNKWQQMTKNVRKRQKTVKNIWKNAKKKKVNQKFKKWQKWKTCKKNKNQKWQKHYKKDKNEKIKNLKWKTKEIQKFQNSIIYKIKKKKKFFASRILILFVLCVSFFLVSFFLFFLYFLSFCIFQKHYFFIIFIFDEIPPLFCVFQQYSRPFVFRADTLCCWSDGSVLSRLLLRNHYRVGTFIGVDFSVFQPILVSIAVFQRFGVSAQVLSWFQTLCNHCPRPCVCCMAPVTWKCGSFSLAVTCTFDRGLDTEIRVLSTAQSRNRTSTESDKYSQILFMFLLRSFFGWCCCLPFFLFGVAFLLLLWVELFFPLSSVAWCRLVSSFCGWCCCFSFSCLVVLSSSSFGWDCFFPRLLLGGAAWSPPPFFSHVALFPSPVRWCCLPSPPLGEAAFTLSSVRWCCLVSSSFGWCCVSPLLLRGAAFISSFTWRSVRFKLDGVTPMTGISQPMISSTIWASSSCAGIRDEDLLGGKCLAWLWTKQVGQCGVNVSWNIQPATPSAFGVVYAWRCLAHEEVHTWLEENWLSYTLSLCTRVFHRLSLSRMNVYWPCSALRRVGSVLLRVASV